MSEYRYEPIEPEAGGGQQETPEEPIAEVIRREVRRSAGEALGEAMGAARCSVIVTAAGAGFTAVGSALLLLGVFKRLDQILVTPWSPYAIAGGVGLIVGAFLCVIARPRRHTEESDE